MRRYNGIYLIGIGLSCLNHLVGGFAFRINSHCPNLARKSIVPEGDLTHMTICGSDIRATQLNAQPPSIGVFLSSMTSSIPDATIPVCSIVGSFLLLGYYHIQLYRKETQGNATTWRSAQADTREAWAKYVRETEGWLYAIQTLRNAITAQTFLATTVLSVLTVITGKAWDTICTTNSKLVQVQFGLVGASMVSSAYQFLQSARLMTHCGFMFPVNPKSTKPDRIMRRSQHAQWMGLRCLYLAAGFLSWVMGGPIVFLFCSVLLTLFFKKIDRVPKEMDNSYTYDI